MKAPPATADLLEQAEIALEWAVRTYQNAAAHLHRAKPAQRQQASYELSLAMKEVLRQRAHRDRLLAEIAHARAAAGLLPRPAPLPIAELPPLPGPEHDRDDKAPSRRLSSRR